MDGLKIPYPSSLGLSTYCLSSVYLSVCLPTCLAVCLIYPIESESKQISILHSNLAISHFSIHIRILLQTCAKNISPLVFNHPDGTALEASVYSSCHHGISDREGGRWSLMSLGFLTMIEICFFSLILKGDPQNH